jgi:CRP-like cAMP-binding protein
MGLGPNPLAGLLKTLRPDLFGAGLKEVAFERGALLARRGEEIGFLYLLKSGLVSYTIERGRIETASIGRNGAVGAAAVLGNKLHLYDIVASLPATVWAIEIGRLADIAEEVPSLRALLFKTEQYTMAQAQQIAACNTCHTISERFAGWLLRTSEETGENAIHITQEEIAYLLGAQRATISLVAHALQESDALRYWRETICITDRAELERYACACHAGIRAQYDKLFGLAEQRAALVPDELASRPGIRADGSSYELKDHERFHRERAERERSPQDQSTRDKSLTPS